MVTTRKKWVAQLAFVLAFGLIVAPATAAVVDIGGGWEAVWDGSLYPTVDINPVGVYGEVVYIEKSAEFTQPPAGEVFPAIPIIFRQTVYPAAMSIVIDDEIIMNSTGADWSDFHIDILNGPDAVFNPDATAGSGGPGPIGWSIAPFTEAAFSPDLARVDIWGGVVKSGECWFPGDGALNGQLWIDVNPRENEPFTVFTLKEMPTPEPATIGLLALGGAGLILRKRGK